MADTLRSRAGSLFTDADVISAQHRRRNRDAL
jgi:hypothetical protein